MTTPLLRLQAFTGIAAAREALNDPAHRWCEECGDSDFDSGCFDEETGSPYCGGCGFGRSDFDPDIQWSGLPRKSEFVKGLLPLYTAAAPGVECANCDGKGNWRDHQPCPYCPMTPGKVPDPHALLGLAVAEGRECLKHQGAEVEPASLLGAVKGAPQQPLRTALDSAEAWLKEPTEERLTAWHTAWVAAGGKHWLPKPWVGNRDGEYWAESIRVAFKLIDREIVGRCAVEEVSEECGFCAGGLLEGEDLPDSGCPDCKGTLRVERNTKESDA